MKVMQRIVLSAVLTSLPFAASAQGKPAHKDALLYFVWPQNGATIKGGFCAASEYATWALRTPAIITRTAAIIIC